MLRPPRGDFEGLAEIWIRRNNSRMLIALFLLLMGLTGCAGVNRAVATQEPAGSYRNEAVDSGRLRNGLRNLECDQTLVAECLESAPDEVCERRFDCYLPY